MIPDKPFLFQLDAENRSDLRSTRLDSRAPHSAMGPGPQAPFVDPAVSVLAQGRIGPAAAYLQARRAALSFLERNCRGRYPDQRQDRRWNVVIGTNCTIFQQVTIGDARHAEQEG